MTVWALAASIGFTSPSGRVIVSLSLSEEVENIPQHTGFRSVNFRVFALGAGDRRELLVLNVEDLGQTPSRCSELIGFVHRVRALGTNPVVLHHRPP